MNWFTVLCFYASWRRVAEWLERWMLKIFGSKHGIMQKLSLFSQQGMGTWLREWHPESVISLPVRRFPTATFLYMTIDYKG